ncbi:MAG TPA: hypothetical protein VL793_17295, partial [Patescibacteria group bacterium]|nr:hypothetical protein [Patescibacteria group bacterium]
MSVSTTARRSDAVKLVRSQAAYTKRRFFHVRAFSLALICYGAVLAGGGVIMAAETAEKPKHEHAAVNDDIFAGTNVLKIRI